MKCKLSIKVTLVVASMAILPTLSWGAEDGADIYKKKCAGCHGAAGEGKPAMKAPALKGAPDTADQIVERVTKGHTGSKAPHAKAIAGVTDAQAKAVADFIKTL
jgi:cytochrome c